MSQNYHTPFVDATTQYKAAHHNVPLGELDTQITTNVANIAANLAKFGSMVAGKFVMVNEGATALIYRGIVCSGGDVVVSGGEVVVN